MFGGFDPSGEPDRSFFERKRLHALLGALLLVGGGLGSAFYAASLEGDEEVQEEIIDAEVQSFELEEEPEEEPEPEPEPPPPEPPTETPKKSKPKPAPDIQNVKDIDEQPAESDVNTEGQEYGGGGGGNDQRSKGDDGQKPPAEPEKPKPAPDKPKPKPKAVTIDPDKPIERPADATVPKKIAGDPVAYPAQLRQRNITGKVKLRLTIYKDGSVKKVSVLAKDNSADKDADPKLYELANKLFLKAVAAAVQTWKYEPSKYKGKAITVYQTITIPFSLD